MRREQAAAAVTVLAIVGLIIALAIREQRRAGGLAEAKPSSVVFALYQRAKAGDIEGYLSCLDGDLRRTMESSRQDMGDGAFRERIVGIGNAVKGVTVTEERGDAREARLRVELVYADRSHNDVQTFTVSRRGSEWLIGSMSGAERLKMPVPYGTPAYPEEGK